MTAELFQRDREWQPPAYTPIYKSSVTRSPNLPLLSLEMTASELTAPRFGHGDIDPIDGDLIANYAKTGDPIGERIIVYGRVLDENGRGGAGIRWSRSGRPMRAGAIATATTPTSRPSTPISAAAGAASPTPRGAMFRTIKPGAYPWPQRDQLVAACAYPLFASSARPLRSG
jgi:protocatechuate 3,4-dioxygenase, beta subunit